VNPALADSPDVRELIQTLRPFDRRGRIWIGVLIGFVLIGAAAYVVQLVRGLAVTAMNDYFSWGIYIINFVFFVGISMAGTLISAMLRLTGAEWRRPITRLAEAITLFALLVAAPMVIIDMGRPDRFLYVLRYARLQSPILWDVLSLNTYLAGSFLYLYLPLIPDLALLRDHAGELPPWRRKLYTVLALNWHGNEQQRHRLERAIAVMAIVIIPVAISIHTVTSWIFGMTLRPGWHTTIIGPDFVIGALYSGIAAVITAMALFRHCLHLDHFIQPTHFKKLGLLLLVFCLAYIYFLVNEYLGPGYARETAERRLLSMTMKGEYSLMFWAMIGVGLVAPLLLLANPWTHTMRGIVLASVLVNVGMWLKRYIIIIPTLNTTYLPPWSGKIVGYVPTIFELAISAGALAAFFLMYTLFAKVFPIVSMWEVSEGHSAHGVPGGKTP
jgi:Ni/Fe-hydrogenase subunit HybB-like protein